MTTVDGRRATIDRTEVTARDVHRGDLRGGDLAGGLAGETFTHLSLINAALTLDAQLDVQGRPGQSFGDGLASLTGRDQPSSSRP